VLLINTNKWRQQSYTTRVIDALIRFKEHVVLPDQYGLNVVFANNWYMLDPRWNWSASGKGGQPYLVHFLHIKPIFKSCYSNEQWKQEFFHYLNQTPWKGFKPVSEWKRRFRLLSNVIKKRF